MRLRSDGLGLGPGAVCLAVRSGRFHLQLRLRAGTVNNLEQVHIQFMARGACCRCKIGCAPTLRAVQVLQPLQQVRLRFLAREFVVPERIQERCNPAQLERDVLEWLDDSARRERVAARFTELHQLLRQNTAQRATDALAQVFAL